MELRTIFTILLFLNTVFLLAIWHMSHNFMLREGKTRGLFGWKREDAYRFAEYVAILAFLATDVLYIWQFLG